MRNMQALNAYQNNNAATQAEVASPYRLVQMLFEALLDNIARSRGAMERKDYSLKGISLGKCLDILAALRTGLDLDDGGEVAGNLASLYQYCSERITKANLTNEPEILDEVSGILVEIKSGWDQLEASLHG
ncbi:flagellar export chaperone FliS [Spongorhabdus nitratireducens]